MGSGCARPPRPAVVIGDAAADFHRAKALHLHAAREDDAAAAGEAQAIFQALAATDDASPLLDVYRGSGLVLEAKRTAAPWKKGSLVREGIAFMDAAVEAAPNNAEVRRVRGESLLGLPEWMGAADRGRADLRAAEAMGRE